ncbi:MAG: hypothetical protein AB1792_02900 [Candidatus Zixiibacteriota bacterium]
MPRSAAEHIWYSLPPLEADAATQMALDAVLLARCERRPGLAYLRFYRMVPPAVTIGRHQRWRHVIDPEACAAHGWDWVRRPTGGGALLHRDEINYAVVGGRRVIAASPSVGFRAIFTRIIRALASGAEELGLNPELPARHDGASDTRTGRQHGLCGRSLTRHELGLGGGKLVAAAQLLEPSAVLQHGTIYQRAPDPDDRFWPLGPNGLAEESREQRWVDLGVNHRSTSWVELAAVLQRGFQKAFAVDLDTSEPGSDVMHEVGGQVAAWQRTGWHRRC